MFTPGALAPTPGDSLAVPILASLLPESLRRLRDGDDFKADCVTAPPPPPPPHACKAKEKVALSGRPRRRCPPRGGGRTGPAAGGRRGAAGAGGGGAGTGTCAADALAGGLQGEDAGALLPLHLPSQTQLRDDLQRLVAEAAHTVLRRETHLLPRPAARYAMAGAGRLRAPTRAASRGGAERGGAAATAAAAERRARRE